jgi:hypothetical protein
MFVGFLLVAGCSPDARKPADQEVSTDDTVSARDTVSADVAAESATASSELLRSWMTGSFDNAAQSTADGSYRHIELHAVPVWPERTPGFWIYVEQYLASRPDVPYRQRVHYVTAISADAFRSRVFSLPRAGQFAGPWDADEPLRDLEPDSLTASPGCDIVLVRAGFSFVGSTNGTDCPNVLRGASHATSEVRITADTFYSWDRGFDPDGVQVWGPIRGGYEFRRSE